MSQNTKFFFVRRFFMAVVLSMFFLSKGNVHASQGSDLAKEMLQKIRNVSTEQDLNALLQKATQEKSQLSTQDRIEYAEYLYYVVASSTGANSEELSFDAMRLIPGVISEQEMRAGRARLLSSGDPVIREFAGNFELAGSVKLPNGEMGQDLSVFDLALHDPKVPQDRLIGALFKAAPVESAQWFADHTGLPADERAGLESDLKDAWKLHRAVHANFADPGRKAMLNESVKNPLLDHWQHSPSWILRSLSDGLLRKRPEWQTPDLKKAMQPVQVPKELQVSSPEGQPGSK
jgi:hypothetical protein